MRCGAGPQSLVQAVCAIPVVLVEDPAEELKCIARQLEIGQIQARNHGRSDINQERKEGVKMGPTLGQRSTIIKTNPTTL